MRIFVRHDATGRIVSVLKAAVIDPSVTEPHGDLQAHDGVVEITPTPELEALDCHDFHDRFDVDIAAQTLRQRG